MRCDHTECASHEIEEHTRIFRLDGTSTTDIWAVGMHKVHVGKTPVAYHFDGETWTRNELPLEHGDFSDRNSLRAVQAVRKDLAFAVGDNGHMLGWDGHLWEWSPTGTRGGLWGIFVAPEGHPWVLGAQHPREMQFKARAPWEDVPKDVAAAASEHCLLLRPRHR